MKIYYTFLANKFWHDLCIQKTGERCEIKKKVFVGALKFGLSIFGPAKVVGANIDKSLFNNYR